MQIKFFLLIFNPTAKPYNKFMKLMTYNIKYANEKDGENSWSKRKKSLTSLMQFYAPDIFGLQEALHEQLDYFKEHLPGYSYIGTGRNEDGKGELTPVLYKTEKFEVLESNTFWLSETPEKYSKGWDAAYPRICTYVLFQEKGTGKKFWHFNTHLDHRGDKAREESVKLLWQKIEEVNLKNYPVILTGDFNLEPESKSIKYLSKKLNDSKTISKEAPFGPDKTFNAYEYNELPISRIDYIFISEGVEVSKYGVLNNSYDQKYPSDHFPVMVQLQIK
ncbi:endonuclease/exonuclease/phosphatase family protein [Salegentibacter sp. F188]|uniref:Endonuclease/exonuclease/phosphatase family protein n=1 Tax=Autumnicola patrickiae TaxID=3075591 RepID=A0ABU3DYB2_9FLAO|nr:endonuclease/exonuclease/phosphatase family protein [Salegentibacter sp. F188]MDT0688718.1 endonuclease/exonuclease/phosphatase family protein [Salegentibacter sp. F188]